MIVRTTADGSPTLFIPALDEHYHSMNGAIRESRHVYIDAAFKQQRKPEIHLLEMGFGTGLNALLTAVEARNGKIAVFYTALEKFPLPDDILDRLNYPEQGLFQTIHRVAWENFEPVNAYFHLKKVQTDFNDFDFPDCYDVVYYDAFAPDKQPEAWSAALFEKLFAAMNRGGIMTTYCAKGNVRRMIWQAGFVVERLPGAPGKREMLRGKVL